MANIFNIAGRFKQNVYLVNSPMGDNSAWYYILLDGLKKPIFEAKIGKEALDLKDYGQILYSGWGAEPPADIQKKIEEQFS